MGEQYDSNLGNYYLRARYYNSETGRFTRKDTYEGRIGEPLTLHKYIYTHNNPVNGIDPTGFLLTTEEAQRRALETNLQAQQAAQTVVTQQVVRQQTIEVVKAVVTAFARAIETSIRVARMYNRQFKIPVVFWGNDLSDTTDHQFRAVTGSGYTFYNDQGTPGLSLPISPALNRRANEYPRGWRRSQPQYRGVSRGVSECDEFPYAITEEGGRDNYMRGLVSLHTLDASQNGSNGRRLRTFMDRAGVTPITTNPRYSLFLNIPVPSLGLSFGLDRNGVPVSIYDGG